MELLAWGMVGLWVLTMAGVAWALLYAFSHNEPERWTGGDPNEFTVSEYEQREWESSLAFVGALGIALMGLVCVLAVFGVVLLW